MGWRINGLMARQFRIPLYYRGGMVSAVKEARAAKDPRKRDKTPSVLDFGPVVFYVARSFGFCYGVENAVEIAYEALERHPDKRLFMLSEMIHNPHVNDDLRQRGMHFLRTTTGEQLIPMDTLAPDDIVLIPAFGTTRELKQDLKDRGLDIKTYDTTCPFVVKVWRRSTQLGQADFTVVVHGKRYHEETRATFSHARQNAPVVVVRDIREARDLGRVITQEEGEAFFFERFHGKYSDGFDPARDLRCIGVVNQTTMLVSETQVIAAELRQALVRRYGADAIANHFADTSDTLCYATHENQESTRVLLETPLDIALVVGGYNSSNTSQLVSLCAEVVPTYFIKDAQEILSPLQLKHFDYANQTLHETKGWMPEVRPLRIALTAGASCPDAQLDQVIHRIIGMIPGALKPEEMLTQFHVAAAA